MAWYDALVMSEIVFNRQQSRQVDQRAVDELGIPSIVLMENAARGAADAMLQYARDVSASEGAECGKTAILCYKGNNGGDGLAVARRLLVHKIDVCVALLASPEELQGDAAANYAILHRLGGVIHDLSGSDDLPADLTRRVGKVEWLVDGLLGTGATGAPRAPLDEAIRWMNAQPARRMALDVPSGLDCDTGEAADPTLRADLTCTFATLKTGFQKPAAAPYLGRVVVCDIGFPVA